MEHHEPSERGRSPGLVTEPTFSALFAVVGVTLVVLCGQPDLDERLDTFLLLILVSILFLGIIGSIYLLYFVKRYRRSLIDKTYSESAPVLKLVLKSIQTGIII